MRQVVAASYTLPPLICQLNRYLRLVYQFGAILWFSVSLNRLQTIFSNLAININIEQLQRTYKVLLMCRYKNNYMFFLRLTYCKKNQFLSNQFHIHYSNGWNVNLKSSKECFHIHLAWFYLSYYNEQQFHQELNFLHYGNMFVINLHGNWYFHQLQNYRFFQIFLVDQYIRHNSSDFLLWHVVQLFNF